MGYTIIQQHVSLSGYKQRFHSSEVSKKIAAVNESDFPLVIKCLELCHALAGQGKAFRFSLTIGSTFTFSLDSREGKKTPLPSRKKKSPSTLRRNAKRKEDFLKKKSSSDSASATDLESNQKVMLQRPEFQCDNLSLFLPVSTLLPVQPGTRTGLNPVTTVIWTLDMSPHSPLQRWWRFWSWWSSWSTHYMLLWLWGPWTLPSPLWSDGVQEADIEHDSWSNKAVQFEVT